METQNGNTVQSNAIGKQSGKEPGNQMDEQALFCYQSTMAMARRMLSDGIITEKDYHKIDRIIAGKYGISLCSIYRG